MLAHSNRTIERMCLYSAMDAPMTSCGCFECILAVLPEVNGFMLVNREYAGMTPLGMPFSTLAGSVGGGHQTPGFLGVGRRYAISNKFVAAEGGLPRLVWMSKELKAALADGLRQRAEELGMPDLVDKIATEDDATTVEELMAYPGKSRAPGDGDGRTLLSLARPMEGGGCVVCRFRPLPNLGRGQRSSGSAGVGVPLARPPWPFLRARRRAQPLPFREGSVRAADGGWARRRCFRPLPNLREGRGGCAIRARRRL